MSAITFNAIPRLTGSLVHERKDEGMHSIHLPLKLSKVSKRYGEHLVLDNIELEIPAGRSVSIIGASGSGKSTLLRIMANLEPPSSGSVQWWGQDARILGSTDRRLGMVFQDSNLLPWANVAANVALPLRLQGVNKTSARERALYVLRMVGLEPKAKMFPRELSGGMRMRVSIARALVTEPNLLFMDEPFGALDEITREQLNDDVLRIQAELGVTIILVTHSIQEAVYIGDTILVLRANPGRIGEMIALQKKREFWRDGDNYRVSDDFFSNVRIVSQALRK
ncbi:ABC transporter ATP-binding protein [Acidithiobacillus sp.]|uniref:ABC transporter ATP-binding protein n=1 Tax=Acidithiobacillus sp. TaxID=1872118 RepID=UPI0032AF2E31